MNPDFFYALEQKLQHPETRYSADALDEVLAEAFLEFASSGNVYDKTMILHALAQGPVGDGPPVTEMHDYAMRPLAPEVVLVTYRSVHKSDDGKVDKNVRRSSIWSCLNGRWQMLFHQGTIIPPG